MDQLLQYFNAFNVYAKANPLVAGAVSLWGLGVLTWICRGVPRSIWRFCKSQFTTSLSFTSDPNGTNAETFANFMRWFQETRWAGWSRSLSIQPSNSVRRTFNAETEEDVGTVIGVGDGTHFFMYRGWPFWMTHSRVTEGGNQNRLTYQVHMTGLGRNRQRVLDLIEEFRFRPPKNRTGIYRWAFGDWSRACDTIKRPLNTVVVKSEIKQQLLSNLERWRISRKWYEDRGLPYKMTCILRGMPGTGKTSLIKALAGHLNMNVCLLNLHSMSDASLEEALSEVMDNSIIVIEDFDSSVATHARKALQTTQPPSDSGSDDSLAKALSGLTLSGLLNALDGIMALDGKIIFMTTNVYEALDPALIRKGRIDYTYELGLLTDTEVREYIELMFPGTAVAPEAQFADILGCDLQDLYFQHHEDATTFVEAIPKPL